MGNLKRTNSDDPDFSILVPALDAELRSRYDERQDIYDTHNITGYLDTVVIACDNGKAVGCGCFRRFDDHTVEIKRMFLLKEYRGKGIASSILKELETWAWELNYSITVLETGIKQPEAIGLYKKQGYLLIANYRPYEDLPDSVCMRKSLISKKETAAIG